MPDPKEASPGQAGAVRINPVALPVDDIERLRAAALGVVAQERRT